MAAKSTPGRVVGDRYELIAPIGSGAMGTVWAGVDLLLDRQVAVKEIALPQHVTDRETRKLRKRMLREARTAARLSHPNVVTVYDVLEEAGRAWIVMALVQARSLRDILNADGPLTAQQTARVGLQLLAALRAAHLRGIVHRDVKPGNVLIGADGHAVLADFGIARAVDGSTLTTAGTVMGSPSYIAPERARGERGGPASDLWSLGATLYAAVEGRPPYDRGDAVRTLAAVVTEEPDPPRRAGPLWPVISGLLRVDAGRRLDAASAQQMLCDVAESPQEPPPGVPAVPPAGAGNRADRGRPTVTLTREEPARPVTPAGAQAGPSSATVPVRDVQPTERLRPADQPTVPVAARAGRKPPVAPAGRRAPVTPLPRWKAEAVARRRRRSWAIGVAAALVLMAVGALLMLLLTSGPPH